MTDPSFVLGLILGAAGLWCLSLGARSGSLARRDTAPFNASPGALHTGLVGQPADPETQGAPSQHTGNPDGLAPAADGETPDVGRRPMFRVPSPDRWGAR